MSEFNAGDKVTHSLFGHGVVASVSGSGPDARVTVDFSSSVGRKKLIASVAKLQKSESGPAESAPPPSHWFEALEASGRPRRGRRPDSEKLRDEIRAESAKPEFWIAVRERLRARGTLPKVVDDPNGLVSIAADGLVTLGIRVRHDSPAEARDSAVARAIFDELDGRVLRDFESFKIERRSGLQFQLVEDGLVFIEESDLGDLPARESKMRPKRVQPKGVIRSIPKRRDDY